jgi:ribonuclease Y
MSLFNNLSSLFGTQATKQEAKQPGQKSSQQTVQSTEEKRKRRRRRSRRASAQATGAAQGAQLLQAGQASQQAKDLKLTQAQIAKLKQEAQQLRDQAQQEAQDKAREIMVEARAEALKIRSQAEKETKELNDRLLAQQQGLDQKLDRIDKRLELMDQKEEQLEKERERTEKQQQELEKTRQELMHQLEDVSGMTREEARAQLFDDLEKKLSREMAQQIRQREEEAKVTSEEKVKEILIDSMVHGATDYVPEYTVSIVQLPNEDSKGKIIGKAGRNINSFEHATGVDVDLDMSPTEVRLSCFDPVRREIARISLERLLKDGRIQPSRIEEVVDKVKKELDKVIFEAGKNLCHELGIYNLPVDLMRLIGRFKYRFSYGQNLIAHTLEETKIGIKLAHEMNLDVQTVKLGCLLHDIGKVSEETEGSHVELGVKIAKRFNLPQPVIDCIAQHHEDEPFSGPEQMAVYAADAISGARPGARYENYDEYVKRLQQLEEIATQYPEVRQAYAIQAGREIRVLLEAERSKDDDVTVLGLKIRDEIKEKVTYPGTVTVTVIRESRGQHVAN